MSLKNAFKSDLQSYLKNWVLAFEIFSFLISRSECTLTRFSLRNLNQISSIGLIAPVFNVVLTPEYHLKN